MAPLGAGCEGEVRSVAGSARAIVGTLQPSGGSPDLAAYSVVFLTRAGHFGSGEISASGEFAVPVPRFTSFGAIVVTENQAGAVPGTLDATVIAQWLDSATTTPAGLMHLEGSDGDTELADPLVIDLAAGTVVANGMLPEGITFVEGPYVPADLCSDPVALAGPGTCSLNDVFVCSAGPDCRIPVDTVIATLQTTGLITGPFTQGGTLVRFDSAAAGADPLPDLIAPFNGMAITNLILDIPPVEGASGTLPAQFLNIRALQPGFFLERGGEEFRFTFEDGERVSADDLVSVELPMLPEGSLRQIEITYETTAGNVTLIRCACDNPDPLCTESASCTP